jgi:2-polyprenyl-6-methoxyphenol hydroxylase-like FAD-dependent oxidoreductase
MLCQSPPDKTVATSRQNLDVRALKAKPTRLQIPTWIAIFGTADKLGAFPASRSQARTAQTMTNRQNQSERCYDVLVVGGGTAGVIATTQSAAAGAKTLLVERGSMLGGTITAGGVNFPGLFHAWGKQVIRGYGWQLVTQCVAECNGTLPDFSNIPQQHWRHQVHVDRAVYTMLCDELVTKTGAQVLFHAMPAQVQPLENGWRVTLCGKNGLTEITVGCLVDCTGDANVVTLAGGQIRNSDTALQPGTQTCVAEGYDPETLDLDRINQAFAQAVERGEVSPYDVGWNTQSPNVGNWLYQHGQNANHIPDIDARDSWGRSRLELAGRQSILRLYRFLRRQPGLESLSLPYLAPECGVRETVTIVGDTTITAEDYCSGRQWSEALCHAFYPIDLHTSSGTGLDKRPLQEGVVPSVPRGALLPLGLNRIIVAGRCVSSDRAANSALRVQASAMAMGQAAGAMAALSLQTQTSPRELKIEAIHQLLREHDAIVPTRA